ncbi:MAG: 1-(5-phosphoribosyl)-5-[(5-phosphoribosylamino)methylideneamino]imidazole-4-carboxamide isomerase [Gemmatimonadales bacterium]|jgi:phosphoribosylformimino-5-aminoimidazole carboxamide ribotide isomerase
MLILPAIDLLGGHCVRLRQGRFEDVTVYSDDPTAVAREFVAAGAEALHIVDLDGARHGRPRNLDLVYRIRAQVGVPIEFGGGVRTFALASRIYESGIERIIFGTAAAEAPLLLRRIRERYAPERVAAGIDVRDGRIAIEGWEKESSRDLSDTLDGLATHGVGWVVCTDVNRDGVLTGPSYDLARQIIEAGFQVIVAGGVASLDDIARVREAGAAGCILGSAIYTGRVKLEEALEVARAD